MLMHAPRDLGSRAVGEVLAVDVQLAAPLAVPLAVEAVVEAGAEVEAGVGDASIVSGRSSRRPSCK